MSQLATLLLGASVLVLLQLTVSSAEPVVKFIPPDSFAIGTIFVAKCTVENFVPANVTDKRYSINFDFIAQKLNPIGLVTSMATYDITVGDPDDVTFTNWGLAEVYDVSVARGEVQVFPNFELKVNPRGENARGKYRCSLVVRENDFRNEYKSNVWNGSFLPIPSAVFLAFLATVALKFQW